MKLNVSLSVAAAKRAPRQGRPSGMVMPQEAARRQAETRKKKEDAAKRKAAALRTEEGLVKEIARLQENLKKLRAKKAEKKAAK
jgi:hypothetical protein